MIPPLRAITYSRVSTSEQAESGAGLAAQATALTAALEYRRWSLVDAVVDAGLSGKDMRRPALTAALARLDRGEADVLVVAKLDRLSRSSLDFAGLLERAKRRGWSVVALDVDVDTTTPVGEMVASIMVAVGQWERRMIGLRTRDGMQAMKAAGARFGRPTRLPDEVRDVVAGRRAAGESFRAIADALNADGVPTAAGGRWHPSTVRAVVMSVALDADAAARRGVAA